jgi:ABC-2 type transport system permease protein
MDKLKLVAKHEFLKLAKSRSFIIMTLVIIFLPVLAGLVVGGIAYMSGLSSSGTVGYVDAQGIIGDIGKSGYIEYGSEEAAHEALIGGEISGYYVIPADYVDTGEMQWYSFEGSMITEAFRARSETVIRESLVRGMTQGYLPPVVAERVLEPPDVEDVTLDKSGALAENQGASEWAFLGMGFGMVFIFMVLTPAGYFLTGLITEKENKVMEVLLSSVSPRQLLTGKIVGIGSAGLLQIALVVVGDLVLLLLLGSIVGGLAMTSAGSIPMVATDMGSAAGLGISDALGLFPQGIAMFFVVGLIYFLLGYLLYTILLTMVGTVCNVREQASQWQAPLLLICMLPLFVSVIFGGSTGNAMMVGMGMFPLTAPMTMVMRLSCSVVPVYELAISIGLMILTIGGLFALMPRLVQGDALISGGSFSFRRLVGMREKRR